MGRMTARSLRALTGLAVAVTAVIAGMPTAGAEERTVYFGSSTTQGVGSSPYYRRWTTLLSRYLGWDEINAGLPNSALQAPPSTSWLPRVPTALERWERTIVPVRPDRVFVMYGANDVATRAPVDTFAANFRTLLTRMAGAIGPEKVIVLTPQPNRAGVSTRAPYDAAMREAARALGTHFIDTGRAFPTSFLPEYSQDMLHMNNWGHAMFASYLAAALVDQRLAPAVPLAWGGSALNRPTRALAGGVMRIDEAAPLSGGEVHQVEVRMAREGEVAVGVVRPNERGGYDAVYKTDVLAVPAGTLRIGVPRWRVLGGDRLAVWTQGDVLVGYDPARQRVGHLAVKADRANPIQDVNGLGWRAGEEILAVRTGRFEEGQP